MYIDPYLLNVAQILNALQINASYLIRDLPETALPLVVRTLILGTPFLFTPQLYCQKNSHKYNKIQLDIKRGLSGSNQATRSIR
jgi:hypothetical protein